MPVGSCHARLLLHRHCHCGPAHLVTAAGAWHLRHRGYCQLQSLPAGHHCHLTTAAWGCWVRPTRCVAGVVMSLAAHSRHVVACQAAQRLGRGCRWPNPAQPGWHGPEGADWRCGEPKTYSERGRRPKGFLADEDWQGRKGRRGREQGAEDTGAMQWGEAGKQPFPSFPFCLPWRKRASVYHSGSAPLCHGCLARRCSLQRDGWRLGDGCALAAHWLLLLQTSVGMDLPRCWQAPAQSPRHLVPGPEARSRTCTTRVRGEGAGKCPQSTGFQFCTSASR